MGRSSISVSVAPAVLKWARLSNGDPIVESAEKLKVDINKLEAWEEGVETPVLSLTQLRTLVDFYKRPLATFLLPAPPEKLPELKDCRTLYGEEVYPLSRKVRLAIREARWFQHIAAEIAEDMKYNIEPKIGKALLKTDVEELALRERDRLGIDITTQFHWEDKIVALKEWKNAVEAQNVLVFQLSLSKETEGLRLRGFSLADKLPLALVYNSKEVDEHPKIFSIFHEYAHLMLRVSGICDMSWSNETEIEKFCNGFSGALLVPKNAFLNHRIVKKHSDENEWLDKELSVLSKDFKVSQEVILRRLLIFRKTTNSFYKEWRSRPRRTKDSTGWAPQERMTISRRGLKLTFYILDAYKKEYITQGEAADYLGVSLQRVPKVIDEFKKQTS